MPQGQEMAEAQARLAPGTVTDGLVRQFDALGYAKLEGLLEPRWIELVRSAMPAIYADSFVHFAEMPGKRGNKDMLHKYPAIRQLMEQSPIAPAAAALTGSSTMRYYEDVLVYVEDGWDDQGGWHQDTPTWPLKGSQFANIWFSLEKVTADTGALRIVPGSHKGPFYEPGHIGPERREDFEADRHLWTGGPFPDVNAAPQRFPVHTIESELGDVIIFHPTCLHQGLGMPVGGPRRTITVRLFGDDVGWHRKRCVYHQWMRDAPWQDGVVPDDPRLPLIWAG